MQRFQFAGSAQRFLSDMPRSTTLSTSVAISSRLQRCVGSIPRPSRHDVLVRALLPEMTFNCNQFDRTQQRDKPSPRNWNRVKARCWPSPPTKTA